MSKHINRGYRSFISKMCETSKKLENFVQHQRSSSTSDQLECLEGRLLLSSYAQRGKISVLVDSTIAPTILSELMLYQKDLIADGWTVVMHDKPTNPLNSHDPTVVPRMLDDENVWNNNPNSGAPYVNDVTTSDYRTDLQTVKNLIASDFPGNVVPAGQEGAVVLVGHVAVPYSGLTDYDGHVFTQSGGTVPGRAMPTDQYYADLDGTWTDTTANVSNSDLPGDFGTKGYEMMPNTPGDGRSTRILYLEKCRLLQSAA